jgi:hypothetical protein
MKSADILDPHRPDGTVQQMVLSSFARCCPAHSCTASYIHLDLTACINLFRPELNTMVLSMKNARPPSAAPRAVADPASFQISESVVSRAPCPPPT